MSRLPTLVLLAALSGCSLSGVNRAGVVAATAALACDYGQTRWHAARGWGTYEENNPLLGIHPSTSEVTVYFAGATVLLLAAAELVPAKVRPVVYASIVAVQSKAIVNNTRIGAPVCGLAGDHR